MSVNGIGNNYCYMGAAINYVQEKASAAEKRQGDSVDISGEGRRALSEKMSAARRMEHSGDIGKLSPINFGAYGVAAHFFLT